MESLKQHSVGHAGLTHPPAVARADWRSVIRLYLNRVERITARILPAQTLRFSRFGVASRPESHNLYSMSRRGEA